MEERLAHNVGTSTASMDCITDRVQREPINANAVRDLLSKPFARSGQDTQSFQCIPERRDKIVDPSCRRYLIRKPPQFDKRL